MRILRHGTGRPVLLVHGLGSRAETWAPIIPLLAGQREVLAVDLPGFGRTPPLDVPVTIAAYADALEQLIETERLDDIDLVGSSMGARLVLELARRGRGGAKVALDPGGFWTTAAARYFQVSVGASIRLARALQPVLPVLTGNPVGRTILLPLFSPRPWALDRKLVLGELRSFAHSPALDDTFAALVDGPPQGGAAAGFVRGPLVIGWGRRDRVTLPRQADRARALFPDARLHWFDHCGHFPHWDRPDETAELILRTTAVR